MKIVLKEPILRSYQQLVSEWNEKINLVSRNSMVDFWEKHIVESLLYTDHIQGNAVLDLGSGAGLPGIPLAIQLSEVHFYLIESREKRAWFLRETVQALQLTNVTVLNSTVTPTSEKIIPNGFTTVVARAFGELRQLYHLLKDQLSENGKIVTVKGEGVDGEIKRLNSKYKHVNLETTPHPNSSTRFFISLSNSK
ncbi:MAG: 16S rRNA (guanine(527)-N(7))-methyltransferase RsmG [Methylacidiphilales bacterium]|nr:16S rRNA (guanine(527)-N(7))-methyltransferase RsmG [Candidatus Methylacidiphilales bacterium]